MHMLNKTLSEQEHEDAAAVALEVQKKLIDFQENLPLIKCVTSEAINEEDWREIKEVTGQDGLDRETITVLSFEEFNLKKFTYEIEEIRERAEKKFQLSKRLKSMKDEMKTFYLSQFPYKKTGTFVLKDYDVVNAKLDDFSVLTQGMLGSSYMRGKLAFETRNWNAKLQAMSDLIEEIAKCQRTWMYLEPIFASDDIGKTL